MSRDSPKPLNSPLNPARHTGAARPCTRGGCMAFSVGGLRARDALVTPGAEGRAAARPARRWQFKLFHKLTLVALSSMPALLLAGILAAEGQRETLAAETERQGLAYLTEGWEVFKAAMRGKDVAAELERLEEAGTRYDGALNTASYRSALT